MSLLHLLVTCLWWQLLAVKVSRRLPSGIERLSLYISLTGRGLCFYKTSSIISESSVAIDNGISRMAVIFLMKIPKLSSSSLFSPWLISFPSGNAHLASLYSAECILRFTIYLYNNLLKLAIHTYIHTCIQTTRQTEKEWPTDRLTDGHTDRELDR